MSCDHQPSLVLLSCFLFPLFFETTQFVQPPIHLSIHPPNGLHCFASSLWRRNQLDQPFIDPLDQPFGTILS